MNRSVWQTALYALGYTLILEVLLIAAIEFFPNFEEHIEIFSQMAGVAALKTIMIQLEEGGVVAYVTGQQFFKGCNTLGTAAAILFAVGAVAGEAHRGTLEIWLARPLSRNRILTERFVVGALAVVVPVFLTSATIPYLCDRIGEEVFLKPMMLCSIHQSAMLFAIYGVAFFFSTLGSHPTRIALILLFITTFEFAIYMIEQATYYSIFRWTDIEDFMRICDSGELNPKQLAVMFGIGLVFFAGSLVAFQRRVP